MSEPIWGRDPKRGKRACKGDEEQFETDAQSPSPLHGPTARDQKGEDEVASCD